jgi:hypothetical protein
MRGVAKRRNDIFPLRFIGPEHVKYLILGQKSNRDNMLYGIFR